MKCFIQTQHTDSKAVSSIQQVLIKGKTEKKEDLIALTGLYIEEGNRCQYKPMLAKRGKVLVEAVIK